MDLDTDIDEDYPTVNFKTSCPVHEEVGECKYGLKCRFLGGHARKTSVGSLELVVDEDKKARSVLTTTEQNYIGSDVMKTLRTKKVRETYSHTRIYPLKYTSIRDRLPKRTYKSSRQATTRITKKMRRRKMERPSSPLLPWTW
jgi:hypothetical protein